jgi:hypothetical protein
MTDLEISKALALAIGWESKCVIESAGDIYVETHLRRVNALSWRWKRFDYREWAVIGPIAERYDCFPGKAWRGGWYAGIELTQAFAETPQKAIALAVIQGAKK